MAFIFLGLIVLNYIYEWSIRLKYVAFLCGFENVAIS